MKKLILLLFISLIFSCVGDISVKKHTHNHSGVDLAPSSLSPLKFTMLELEDAHIHIEYSSPSVRNRIIFGGLLPFDEVWQAGAHYVTWLETDKDLIVNNRSLEKGKYAIFMIPRRDNDWSIIFNSRWNQHGKDEYNESEDVIRFDVKPNIDNEFTESLTYKLEKIDDSSAKFSFSWEKTKIQFDIRL